MTLRITLLLGVLLYFYLLLKLLRDDKLYLKYTLLWIGLGAIMMILVVFPDLLLLITKSIGIIEATNGLFAILIFGILIILMSLTSIVSKLNDKNKKLIQVIAILEKRVRELENVDCEDRI
ncbi:DUF2304 domain-containing protein [Clostridium beijerinckii]|uniref:DUF2304 domain-containing protein n=1 Tax=Clostridium beijerinckii TaxID=1520 RepID=UPI00242B3BF2|nr:DUF2304 domain-containing protein [Clostridium beijerinckii]MDG5852748.1 DUF2304 domain-containing protein [Clostridium beijerinckii]